MYEIYLTNGDTREKLHEMDPESDRRVSLCEFTDGVNFIPSAEIAIFPFNPCYERINPMTSIIEIINTKTGTTEFEGRVLKIPTSGMDSSGIVAKRFTCEGFMGYLYDSIQVYHEYDGISASQLLRNILDYHNTNVPDEKKIYLGTCDITGNIWGQATGYAQTMSEIKRLLLTPFGGELWLRRNDQGQLVLDWLKTPETPVTSETTIELSKNMKSLNVDTDATHIITRLIPLGAKLEDSEERLTIANEADGYIGQGESLYKHGICIDDVNAMAQYGVICGTAVFDEITAAHPLVEIASTYIQNNNRVKKSYRAEVLDLSTIGLDPESLVCGNAYRFVNRLIPIDETLRLTKKTVDIFKAHSPIVEIGDKAEKITDIATRAVNFIEYEMPKVKTDILDSAKATANTIINNATHGYVVFNDANNDGVPDEILIMNTADKETATQVWRWNMGGLRFASGNRAYYGDFSTKAAITMDGAITADFITVGVLRSLEILNGTNGQFHVDTSGNCVANAFSSNNATITGGSVTVSGTTGSVVVGAGKIDFFNSSNNLVLEIFGDGTFRAWSATAGNWFQDSFEGVERAIVDIYDKISDHSNRIYALEQAVFNS